MSADPSSAGVDLVLESVSVRYPARSAAALDGLDLSVHAGEFVTVAGRNGAGKSTLSLVAAGFIPRVVRATVDGTVRIGGAPMGSLSDGALRRTAGIVFATPSNQLSASKLTVREELAFGLENLGVAPSSMDARIDAVLERLHIESLADRDPLALSGGEQQRVAIASVVAMGTALLVLDEPTAQLDPEGTSSVARLLVELASAGATVLCTEHDPTVLSAAARCLVLDIGHSVALDIPGRALGSAVAPAIGLRPPTSIILAESVGLDPRYAFDDKRIADAFRLPSGRERAVARVAAAANEDEDDRQLPRIGASRDPVGVELVGVRHTYPGGVEALRGLDLRLEPGQAVAIVGQNGSGKTSLAKHLNGLLRPDAGEIRLAGRSTRERPIHELAADVGFVFQNPDDQLFNRSVEREIGFGPRNLGFTPARLATAVDLALDAVGLAGVRTANPYDLNVSDRKLVALASVLAMDPAVVVLDEPTTGQDDPGIERVGRIVRALRAAGRTIVGVTHDMEFASGNFDRIVVMRQGQIIADGSPAEVFGPPRIELLASTGLRPPVSARIGALLGLGATPTLLSLSDKLRAAATP